MSKTSLDFGFFCNVNQNLKNLLFLTFTSRRTSWETNGYSDLWVVDFDLFLCFCVSWFIAFGRMFLKSAINFTLALSFFIFFILKNGKFRFQGEIVPSKSRRNNRYVSLKTCEDELACSRQHLHLHLFDIVEKPKIRNIFNNAGRATDNKILVKTLLYISRFL